MYILQISLIICKENITVHFYIMKLATNVGK